jgi:NDP-sugar pyrophosphorylase family protein
MQCAILAGGLGTRLRPITHRIPKTLVEVCGRPFADYQLSWLAGQGVDEVVYLIGHKGAMLKDYVGDGSRYGIRVSYVDEGDRLRGTAGALKLASEQGALQREFFTLYGDSYLPIDLPPIWKALRESDEALMTVYRNRGRFDRSNVQFADGRVQLYDKHAQGATADRMDYIDYGLSVIRREAVDREVETGAKADLADFFNRLSLAGGLGGFEVGRRFYEVGSPEGLSDFERYAASEGLGRDGEKYATNRV